MHPRSSVDRSGAAQGLSEVLLSLGTARLTAMMPQFVAGTAAALPAVREGHFMLFVYLPAVFAAEFQPFVGGIVPTLLRGLADVEEAVRDTALKVRRCEIRGCLSCLVPSPSWARWGWVRSGMCGV